MASATSTMTRQSLRRLLQSKPCCAHSVRRAGFSSSCAARDLKTEEAPLEVPTAKKKTSGMVKYDWKDPLRIEQTLLTEDEVAIK